MSSPDRPCIEHLPRGVVRGHQPAHHGRVSQPHPEQDDVEDWRLLQDVLEERDREWWADAEDSDDEA